MTELGFGPYKEIVQRPTAALTLLGIVFFGGTAAAQDARQAVEEFVSRMGEITVTDMVVTQTLTLHNPKDSWQRVTGERRLWIKVPARQRQETKVEEFHEVIVLNGDRLVIQRGGKTFEAPPADRARQRVHTLFALPRTPADLLVEWRSLGVRTEVAESTWVGGRRLTVIGARAGDRQSPSVWLDPDYGVVRFITREDGPGGPKLLDLAFSEHRKLPAGFFFPFRQEIFLDGKLLSVAIVRQVQINTGLPDSLFDTDALLQGASR